MGSRWDRLTGAVARHHYWSVLAFVFLAKLLFWSWSLAVAYRVPLTTAVYFAGGHHYQIDPRIAEHRVDFFSIWIYCDAEWYLSIAEHGYPNTAAMDKAAIARQAMNGFPYEFAPADPAQKYRRYTEWDADAKYAFFPLYPLMIALFHLLLPLHVAAFVVTNLIGTLAFLSLYALVFEYFGDKALAFRTLALLVFYPFSVFYQAYYAEGLFLLLAVLSFYFLKKGRPGLSALSGALLASTKPVGVFIMLPLLILAIEQSTPAAGRAARRAVKLNRKTARLGPIDWRRCRTVCLVPLGLVPHALFNYWNTGYWDYFSRAQARWGNHPTAFLENLLTNVFLTGSRLFSLRFFGDHESIMDWTAMMVFLALILLSYKRLPWELWSFSLVFWLVLMISKDLQSSARYTSLFFPVFLYLAQIRRRLVFGALWACFLAGSLFIDARMVTWRWVG
jgi:hypothetical protein